MEKRILIAAILSIVILFLYQQMITRWMTPSAPSQQKDLSEKSQPAQITEKTISATSSEQKTLLDTKLTPVQSSGEKTVTIETPLYRATFTSIGGGIKGFELKRYKETLDGAAGTAKNIDMVKPLQMPLYSLQTDLLNKGAVQFAMPDKKNILLNTAGQTAAVVLSWESPEGIRIDKKYVFSSDTYNIQMEINVSNKSQQNFSNTISLDLFAPLCQIRPEESSYHHGPIGYFDGKVNRKEAKETEETIKGKIDWIGLEDKYFISAVIPTEKEEIVWSSGIPFKDITRSRLYTSLNLKPDADVVKKYTVYIGPKEYDVLKTLKNNLEEAIDFGWVAFLARPSLVALNFLYSYIRNYGLAIIILTIVIKILFHPLTRQSLNSMKAMQKLQPQMTAIRERYKDDKEKMNRELMELYKRNKVNPIGGCLPMVLQIPVFIALYNVLSASIEMRHAPFILWIHDLSAKDPYFVTPILMGATMLWQQKMTPSAMDPQQAKIMLIMPIIFTFMFLNFSSGLVLYWLVNNVISIAQQYYIQKTTR